MLVKGEIEYNVEDYGLALQTLEATYNLPGIKDKQEKQQFAKKDLGQQAKILQFGERDRCQVFTLLAKAYAKNKKITEAKQVITRAISEFSGTQNEVNVLIANS